MQSRGQTLEFDSTLLPAGATDRLRALRPSAAHLAPTATSKSHPCPQSAIYRFYDSTCERLRARGVRRVRSSLFEVTAIFDGSAMYVRTLCHGGSTMHPGTAPDDKTLRESQDYRRTIGSIAGTGRPLTAE